jgi:4-hydroxy-tetrahydrodipicolinate reductase
MTMMAKLAARFYENAEIIEFHHDQKRDAPSGTAVATAQALREARGSDFIKAMTERETIKGARGGESGGVAVHSVRLPGLVAHQEVIFGGIGETLTIRHDSIDRVSFMPGVLLAVRKALELDHFVFGLEPLLVQP